jgi:hypothetical protein
MDGGQWTHIDLILSDDNRIARFAWINQFVPSDRAKGPASCLVDHGPPVLRSTNAH